MTLQHLRKSSLAVFGGLEGTETSGACVVVMDINLLTLDGWTVSIIKKYFIKIVN